LYINDFWSTLNYHFSAADPSDNHGKSDEFESEVSDIISPSLDYDWSDTAGYTGDDTLLYIVVSDNIAVTEVEIAYWFGSGSVKDISPEVSEGGLGSSQYSYEYISVPENSVDYLHYEVTITDEAGNQFGPTSTVDVPIYDNDPPEMSELSIEGSPVTGGTTKFSIKVTDNVELDTSSVTLHYMEENMGSYRSVTMDDIGSGVFEQTIDIDVSWTGLYCYVSASDPSSNYATSSSSYHYVYDIISPSIMGDASDREAFTGDRFQFSFVANDNTFIDQAIVTYWFGYGPSDTLYLTVNGKGHGEDQHLTGTLRLPSDSLSDLNYFLDIYDREGNWDGTSTSTISIEDNDAPVVELISNPRATTGDDFRFVIGISDNIDGYELGEVHILYCYAGDWSSSVNISLDYDPSELVWGSSDFPIDINTTGPLDYFVTAPDSSGNWMGSYAVQVIGDNDLPDYDWPDLSPTTGTTGDIVPLTIRASDNVKVGSVIAVTQYEDGTKCAQVELTEGPIGTFVGFLPLSPYTISDLTYHYIITDSTGNSVETSDRSVSITDNDPPEIVSDMSPVEAGAGSNYVFKVILWDNIQVKKGWVEYWTSYEPTHIRLELTRVAQGLYYHRFDLSFRAGTLYYFFDCEDIFDHKAVTTPIKEVMITDSVSPVISPLEHPDKATTGDEFTIKAHVTDDVGMDRVRLGFEYSNTPGTITFISGAEKDGSYEFTIQVRHVLADLTFWIEAWDTVGNPSLTDRTTVTIEDDDLPEIGSDLSDPEAATGDTYHFSVSVSDNMGVSDVYAVIELPDSGQMTLPLTSDGTHYLGSIAVRNDIGGAIRYSIRAVDTSGNMVSSEEKTVMIMDDEDPVARISGPMFVDQFEEVTFSGLGSTDNVGPLTYTWTIGENPFSGPEVTLRFDDAGTMLIALIVSDGTNPPVKALHTVAVSDIAPPTIVLNVPDSIGNHQVLTLDASASSDNVGIASYEWRVTLPDHSQMKMTEPSFSLDLEGSLGELSLVLTVKDAKGNTARTYRTVNVIDALVPDIVRHADLELITGDLRLIEDLGSTDNVGISEYNWTVEGPRGTGTFFGRELRYHFSVAGRYSIELTLTDSSGNSASELFNITVVDPAANTDSDGDGMPDIWEDQHGLVRTIDDSGMDPDRDMLSNLEEYEHGTDPLNSDTDGDGLPDDWELLYGFDPVSNDDSEADPDADGYSNLDEYLRSTDPRVSNKEKEKMDPTFIALGSSVAVIVAIILGLFALSRYLSNEWKR
jgi:hypothetical protein